jgi:signal transduction histidine kinase
VVFNDLTNLKELEAQKARAERLASFTALASGLAHEIKNPLVAIRTFAELLPERFTDEEFRSGFSKVVLSEISRIDDLVVRLRGLAAPVVPQFAPLDVCEPIDDTLALLRGHLDQKNISTIRDYMPVRPPISGSHQQLKQLFLNVIMNAIEAMSSGGTLSVAVSAKSQLDLSLVVVRISDTGTGIDPSVMNQMFNPFVTSKPTGSGLGLAISRGIADAHSATITALNNEDGVGATVVLEFPVVSLGSPSALLEAASTGPRTTTE